MNSKVLVYVEGPSDKASLYALLAPVIAMKAQEGISIRFFETPPGDRKESVLTKVPIKAANILINDPHSIVVAMPDLYLRNKGFPHENYAELVQGMNRIFDEALTAKGQADRPNCKERFKVFCLKYDLEALVLAATESLKNRLGVRSMPIKWRIPVEDQNHDCPPKRVVEALYESYGKRYRDTVDAPIILGASNYQEIAQKCNQCFMPFVNFLNALTNETV